MPSKAYECTEKPAVKKLTQLFLDTFGTAKIPEGKIFSINMCICTYVYIIKICVCMYVHI